MATYLSKRDAAATLGVSVKTIERRIRAGKLASTIVHTPHGPQVRVLLDDPDATIDATFDVASATGDVAPATNLVAFPTRDTPGVEGVAPSTNSLDSRDRIPDTLVLQALAEARREGEAWARRYGHLEAERDALRAVVESLRRPWWRKLLDRRRGRGSDA
jgi:hypothetical protein